MSVFTEKIKNSFHRICDSAFATLSETEALMVSLSAEDSLFVRFNGNKVRQNTHVEQAEVDFALQSSGRSASFSFNITGNNDEDLIRSMAVLTQLREECSILPIDEHQVPFTNNGTSFNEHSYSLLPDHEVIEAITVPAEGLDLAGLYCAGPMISANRNSKGQNHWFATGQFFVDFSLYDKEKAAKGSYAGAVWNQKDFVTQLNSTREALDLLHKPKIQLKPGNYRTYLAPAAVSEIASMFNWAAFSYRSFKEGTSAFRKLAEGERKLSSKFSIQENYSWGLSPLFNPIGEVAPEKCPVVENGLLKQLLISTRSAKEYKVQGNFASPGEYFRSMEILPGDLKRENILKEIGTGLYLSNLHYINWSDRANARITGMTRYACFWVKNGQIAGPITDMRFDESLYEALGDKLLAVTDFQAIDPELGTYSRRSMGGKVLPGMLIADFTLTL